MTDLYPDLIDDEEYVDRVLRHKPSSLVPLVGAFGARYSRHGSWLGGPYDGLFGPWALADIARVSLVQGDEGASDATPQDVLECAAAYAAIRDPDLPGPRADRRDSFLLRAGFEQLPFQQPTRHEVGRSTAVFEQTVTPGRQLRVVRPGWDEDLFGCTLSQFIGIGFIAHTLAVKFGGKFPTAWLDDPIFENIASQIPRALMHDVLAYHFTGDLEHFRAAHASDTPSSLRRFSCNPLLLQPIVSGMGEELLVPVPAMVLRKISSSGIWYMGNDRWPVEFAQDVGELFEQYVGRQLQTIPNANVYSEITYDDHQLSVDWIVESRSAVILVEVKSTRATEDIRMGSAEAFQILADKLGHAYEQIENTHRLIDQRHSAFRHIPSDLPRLGLIITMEQFPFANATPIRDRQAAASTVPTIVCSSNELEWLVSLQDRDLGTYLLGFLADPANEGHGVTSGLLGVEFGPNPVLDEAWESYAWGHPPRPTDSRPNPAQGDSG